MLIWGGCWPLSHFFQWNPFFVLSSAFLDHSNAFLVHSRDISILSRKKNQLASLVFFLCLCSFFLCLCSFSSKASQFFSKASHFLPRASTNYTCEVGRLHLWAHFSLLLTGFFLRLLEECNLLCHKYIARQTTSAPEPSTRRVARNGVYIRVQRYLLFVRYAKLFYKKVNGSRHCCCHSPKLC